MTKVTTLHPQAEVASSLRDIAKAYEEGAFNKEECTVIIGQDVFHFGCANPTLASANTLFDCNFAIHKLMAAVVDSCT